MKRFLFAVCLCASLLISGLFFLLPDAEAQNNILLNMLSLPAPPPPNPFYQATGNRSESFFSKNNPPKDDAPIEDLLDYWRSQNQFDPAYAYAIKPSGKSMERLMAEIEKNPQELTSFLTVLSENAEAADFVKRLYESELRAGTLGEEWQDSIKDWLTLNSNYFINDLVERAGQAADTGEYITNQNEVRALARVDWDKARPLLERMLSDASQPISQTLARWAFYEHAMREGDLGDIEKYRKLLQETVENKNEKPGNRDLAMDAIVEAGDFPGRDDWYYSLFEDETLFDLQVNGESYTSLTTLLNHSPAEKYVEKMLELIKSDKQAIRNVAARNLGTLLDEKNPEVVRALLPWLENPKWAKEVDDERKKLVAALAKLTIPESVPGLIAVLNEKESVEKEEIERDANESSNANVSTYPIPANSYTMTNTIASPTSVRTDDYPFRAEAITALATQKDSRAAQPLRAILPQSQGYQREILVRAVLLSNGFSVSEQIDALEAVAKNSQQTYDSSNTNATANYPLMTPTISSPVLGNLSNSTYYSSNVVVVTRSYNPADIQAILGNQIVANPEPNGEFLRALIDRIRVLDAKDAQLSAALRKIMLSWHGAAINSMMLRDLKDGKANTDALVKLLSVRKELREKQSSEVFEARGGENPVVFAVSACLLEEASEYDAILAGENAESKIALFGCARLIRAKLPLEKVAENLKSQNKLLAFAAESYLESEDSPEARQIVLSLHPNEAKILGARTSFVPEQMSVVSSAHLGSLFASVNEAFPPRLSYYIGWFFEDLDKTEQRLRKEIKETEEILGVYAYDGNFIRIYNDRVVFSRDDGDARYRERVLEAEEFDNFKNFLASQRVDELPPFLSACNECETKQLVMLGRSGGRRIFVQGERMPPFFEELGRLFDEMKKPPARLRYHLEKDVSGLEILFADDVLQARAVWKSGSDFRVLVEDAERRKQIDKELDALDEADQENEDFDYEKFEETSRKRREQRDYEHFSWRKFVQNKLPDFADQPAQVAYLPLRDGAAARATNERWKARVGNVEIRGGEDGLYKSSGGAFTKIRNGYYDKPLVTPNGRWAIVSKLDAEEGIITLVRVNLLTNREFPVKFDKYPLLDTTAFIPSINKVLVWGNYGGESSRESDGEFYLLDAETGLISAAAGAEIRPLAQQTFRPLQAANGANEFWAAIPDAEKNETEFGVYNAKTLSFRPLLKIPRIKFSSMNTWVEADKIYFVYEGHLLSLPLPQAK